MSTDEIRTIATVTGAVIATGGALWGILHAVVVKPLRAEIRMEITGLRSDLKTGVAELCTEIAEMETRLEAGTSAIDTKMSEVETRLAHEIHRETPRILPGR
jgi:hypothetical protein